MPTAAGARSVCETINQQLLTVSMCERQPALVDLLP